MYRLIRFLVQILNTVDGVRDTAQFYIDAAVHYEIERQEHKLNKYVLQRRAKNFPIGIPDDIEYCGDLAWLELTDI